MADSWFLIRAGRKVGPLSVVELRSQVASGQIVATDLLWKQGMEQPVPCGRVRGLLPTDAPAGDPVAAGSGGPAVPPPLVGPGAGAVPQEAITAQDVAIGLLIPHKVSGLAVAAGYVGLLSIACVPGPIAIILGILAILDLRKHPGKQGYGRAIFAIVMGSLALIVALLVLVQVVITT